MLAELVLDLMHQLHFFVEGEFIVEGEVGGECVLGGAHGPYVGVVHFLHAGYSQDDLYYLRPVYIVGNGIEGHTEAIRKEPPGAHEDDEQDN